MASLSILELCERIQNAGVSRAISESTWGYPIVGALHVLALALFGAAILIPHLRDEVQWIRRAGITVIVITGMLLFASGAVNYYKSTSFKIKMVLLALIALNTIATSRQYRSSKLHSAVALTLWAAVIFAARGIAFF